MKRSRLTPAPAGSAHHLRFLLILGAVVLGAGGFAAYQYYKVLNSIIMQIP